MRAGQLPNRIMDFLKACRREPVTAAELMDITGWSKSSVHGWARLFVAQGLMVAIDTKKARNVRGAARKAFVVSPQWGGPNA